MDKNRRKINTNISGIKATWVIIIRLKARLGPEDLIRTAYNNAAHAAQRALSWMREEGKTPITQHKPPALFHDESHTRCAHAAFSHNDGTGGTGPRWLDTFGNSFMATLRFQCDAVGCESMSSVQAKKKKVQSSQLLKFDKETRPSALFSAGSRHVFCFFSPFQTLYSLSNTVQKREGKMTSSISQQNFTHSSVINVNASGLSP